MFCNCRSTSDCVEVGLNTCMPNGSLKGVTMLPGEKTGETTAATGHDGPVRLAFGVVVGENGVDPKRSTATTRTADITAQQLKRHSYNPCTHNLTVYSRFIVIIILFAVIQTMNKTVSKYNKLKGNGKLLENQRPQKAGYITIHPTSRWKTILIVSSANLFINWNQSFNTVVFTIQIVISNATAITVATNLIVYQCACH